MLQKASNLITAEQKLRLIQIEEEELELELALMDAEDDTPAEQVHTVFTQDVKRLAYINAYPFKDFVRESFPVIVQGRQYRHSWHIDIICEILQAALIGDVSNFIINQPRRTMKSLLSCVMFPAWVWTFLPHIKFLYNSYSGKFAGRDNEETWKLINSNWYQLRWGNEFSFIKEKKATELRNNKGGARIVFKIGGGTGEGGDFVFADDPNSIEQIESDTILESTNKGWNEVAYNNVTDRETAVRAIVQQRTTPNDLTGNILDDADLRPLYQVLCLPMKYESDHPNRNSPENPFNLGKVNDYDKLNNPNLVVGEDKLWIDPRDIHAPEFDNNWYREWYKQFFAGIGLESKGDEQILLPYMPEKVLAQEIAHLKVFGENSQYQQRPTPRGGQFFNSELFKIVKLQSIDLNNLRLIRYFDKAGSDLKGDFTVGTLMARTKTRPYDFYILDMWREQLSYFKRMEGMKRLAKEDFENYISSKTNNEYTIGIEREGGSSGKDISLIEKEELMGFDVWLDFKKVSKESRAKIVKQRSEGGNLYVVENPVWNKIFFKRLEKYDPKKANQKDDEIDTIGGAIYNLSFMSVQGYSSTDGYN